MDDEPPQQIERPDFEEIEELQADKSLPTTQLNTQDLDSTTQS